MPKEKKTKSILEHLGFGGSQEPDADEKPAVDVEALQKQIADMSSRLEASERNSSMLLTQLASGPRKEPTVAAPAEFKIDYKDLPDPTEFPTEYATAIAKQTQDAVASYTKATQAYEETRRSKASRVDNLWSDFSKTHEPYAGDQTKVEFAAMKVIEDAKAKGLDPERYMFTNKDVFFKDLTTKMDSIFGAPGSENQGSDDDDADDTDADDGRAVSIFGGLESGGKPGKGAKEDDAAKADMIKDLHDLQRKSGFF